MARPAKVGCAHSAIQGAIQDVPYKTLTFDIITHNLRPHFLADTETSASLTLAGFDLWQY